MKIIISCTTPSIVLLNYFHIPTFCLLGYSFTISAEYFCREEYFCILFPLSVYGIYVPILTTVSFSLRIPEGQAEAGSLAVGRLRSLEDQLTRAKQKIHSFQKLTGDGKQGRAT